METAIKGFLVLMMLAVLVTAGVYLVQYQAHAVERHGTDALEVRNLFEKCNELPSMELKAQDRFLYFCFLKDFAALQVTTAEREVEGAKEITSFKVRNVQNYLRNVLTKEDGITLTRSWKDLPEWVLKLLGFELGE